MNTAQWLSYQMFKLSSKCGFLHHNTGHLGSDQAYFVYQKKVLI